MPRGVAIPELKEQLFAAVQRILERDGPSGLSSRAITSEAGVAKGVLHNHFTDLDGFLAEFVRTQFHQTVRDVAGLEDKAGTATVGENLGKVVSLVQGSQIVAAHSILSYRLSVADRLHRDRDNHPPHLDQLEKLISAYLDAEQEQGRVSSQADTGAVALALVATVHYLHRGHPVSGERHGTAAKDVVDVLVKSLANS